MSKIRANFISSKNDNKAVEFTSGIVVGGAVTATNFDFNADTYNGEVYNVGTGASIYQESSNQLKFGIGNKEAIVIRGDESVDIGGTPPWTVTGSGYRNLSLSGSTQSSSGFVWIGNGAATQNNGFDLARINILNGPTIVSQIKGSTGDGNNDSGKITFITKSTGSSLAEAATFTTSGNLAFPSGQGIDFSANSDTGRTVSSNVLNDYEEGTFTATCSSSVILDGSGRLCQYVKIGNMVTVMGQIQVSDSNGGQGLTINNLPFIVVSNGEGSGLSAGAVRLYNSDMASDHKYIICMADPGSNDLAFQGVRDNATSQVLAASNNGYYMFNIVYRTS